MIVVEILLCLLAAALLVPVSVFFVQVLMALPAHRQREIPHSKRPSVTVLVPAHNEAYLIAGTLRSIVPQLAEQDRLLVVADNCSDETARIAAAAGADVIERNDTVRRGKGYALDFGVRHMERDPPQVVLIIDADCQVDRGTIDRLARVCLETGRPVQALYLMHSPEGADFTTRIAEFAWLVKNMVRPLGYHRLGMPCQLMGTGMAFPWPAISAAPLADGLLQEETRLGIHFARIGMPPLFYPEARVTSFFPNSTQGIEVQRTQWEHGHLWMIFGHAPRLLAQAFARGNMSLMALVLDMCVPPLALLMLLALALAVFAGSAAFLVTTMVALPLWLAAMPMLMLVSSVLLCWAGYGRSVISLGRLAGAPIYALWKIPVYWKFLMRRHTEWVRSRRDGE